MWKKWSAVNTFRMHCIYIYKYQRWNMGCWHCSQGVDAFCNLWPVLTSLWRESSCWPQVYIWVLNDEEDFQRAFDLGATGVMTDFPTRLKDFLDREGTSEPRWPSNTYLRPSGPQPPPSPGMQTPPLYFSRSELQRLQDPDAVVVTSASHCNPITSPEGRTSVPHVHQLFSWFPDTQDQRDMKGNIDTRTHTHTRLGKRSTKKFQV